MVAIAWGKQIVEIISSLSNLAGQVYCKTIDISITLEMVWELCVRWGGRFRGSLSSNSKCNTTSPAGLSCCHVNKILSTHDCRRT